MAINPTPVRQFNRVFVTPKIEDFIRIETVDISRTEIPEYGTPHPDTDKYRDFLFVYPASDDPQGLLFKFYYAKPREKQDDYNFEFVDADVGGTRFEAVKRTYVLLRSEFDPAVPAMGDDMPTDPDDRFSVGEYVLADRTQKRIGEQQLDSLFILEERTYIQRTTIWEIGVDSLNGKPLTTRTDLYYRTEVVSGGLTIQELFDDPTNAYWGLLATGYQRSGRQLSAEWYLVETTQVVAGTFSGGAVAVDSFYTNDNYYWPPVLDTYELLDWERNDGGIDYFPAARFRPEGYNGPCRMLVERSWSKNPFTIAAVETMRPTRIYYASPFFTLNLPECLHTQQAISCDIGNTDPVYAQNTGSTRYFAATNYTTWPASIVAYDDQEPFRGGYLRTKKTAYPPTIDPSVNWTTGAPIV